MASDAERTFGGQLRRLREAAGLTQAELAERADLSPNAISALERGERTRPYPHTVRALAAALGLSEAEQSVLALSARGGRVAPPERRALPPLPQPITPLFGREPNIAAVVALLDDPDRRLVTLFGPGGVGKTRLALAVAQVITDRPAIDVAFVDLSAVRDPEFVVPVMAHALGVPMAAGSAPADRLAATLRGRDTLLVLDNFEQVVAAGPAIAALVADCAQLRLLITSRTMLRVRGEHLYPVEPLMLPAPTPSSPLTVVAASPAVALFVASARAVRPDFVLTEANAADVAAICGRLDGLPLAIELAAVRLDVLSPRALRARLASRLRVLTTGPRDLPARQQRLRDAIAWSFDLLSPREQIVCRRFAVFAGGATADAIAEVIGDQPEATTVDVGDVLGLDDLSELLDSVEALVGHSFLVSTAGDDGEPRFRMLETIREFATEQLAASGEAVAVQQRHAGWFLALAEEAEPRLGGAEQDAWLDRLQSEYDNMRAALDWAIGAKPILALRLAVALSRFWFTRGYPGEGRQWLERALAASEDAPVELRAGAWAGAGKLAFQQGDLAAAASLYEESLAGKRARGDSAGVASLLSSLGNVAREQGELDLAMVRYKESAALHRQLGDDQGLASVLNNLGTTARYRGELTRAAQLHTESLAYRRRAGDTWGVAYTLTCLGRVAFEQGELGAAERHLSEALALQRKLGDSYGTALTLAVLAEVALAQGDLERAGSAAGESYNLFQEHGDPWGIATSRLILGRAAAARGDWDAAITDETESLRRFQGAGNLMGVASGLESLAALAITLNRAVAAAMLLAAADAARTARGIPASPVARVWIEQAQHEAARALGEPAFAAAWAGGCRLSVEDAVTLAIDGVRVNAGEDDVKRLPDEQPRFGT